MVLASASDPVFFDAASLKFIDNTGKETTRQFIGGSCIAENPAMYSYLFAADFMKVNSTKITVTSVGSQQFQSPKVDAKVSPLQWF